MKRRTLLIGTRQGTNEEFRDYWLGNEERLITNSENGSTITEPLIIQGDQFLVIILNGADLPVEPFLVEQKVLAILLKHSNYINVGMLEESEIGMIWHGYDPLPDIEAILPASSLLRFNKKYSSSIRGNFNDQIEGTFYPNIDATKIRMGVYDAFRDSVVLNEQSNQTEHNFVRLWNYFDRFRLNKSLRLLKKLVNRRKLSGNDFSRNWFEEQLTDPKLLLAIELLLSEDYFPKSYDIFFDWIDQQLES